MSKKSITTKIIQCFVALALTGVCAPVAWGKNPVAEVTINDETTPCATIDAAWELALGRSYDPSVTLTLLQDATLTNALTTTQGVIITINLNDKVLRAASDYTGSLIVNEYADAVMTIRNGMMTGAKDSALSSNGELTLENVVLTGNSGAYGGAIYIGPDAQLMAKDCVFTNNSASQCGGAIYKEGGSVMSQDKCVLIRTLICANTAGEQGGGIYYQKSEQCLAAGTRVRMSDGSEKAIEDVVEGDVVKTFDHEGGTNSTARVYIVFKGTTKSTPLTLEFETQHLSIVGKHDLLEMESRKYVTITGQNAAEYIGKKFYGEDGAWHTLTGVTWGKKAVDYYSLYTAQHMNVYADGMLTVASDVDFLPNLYELDANLKADAAQLAADIATYGLVSYAYVDESLGVSEAWYEDANVKYYWIAYGKGPTTRARVLALCAARKEKTSAETQLGALSFRTASDEPTLEESEVGRMTLGENVIVTNNFAGSAASNIHLKHATDEDLSLLVLATAHDGICAGVTLACGAGQFTQEDNVVSTDVALFMSDSSDFSIRQNAEGYLELYTLPAASVTGKGETTYYTTLEEAWEHAASSEYNLTNVLVTLLKDATVTKALVRSTVSFIGYTFTLDLNDHVLAYAGEDDDCVVEQTGGMALEIIDTATTRTPHYFTCDDATGLWTLTNGVTDRVVSGGLITGGRASAVRITYGPQTNVIRNVNFVGNRYDTSDGGALSVGSGTLEISNATFLGNISSGNGGAIQVSVPCVMTDCRVAENVAGGFGGGVYLKRSGSLVRTEIVGNKAGTGGGVYLTYGAAFCFPAGTQILMADGTEKSIEDIVEGNVVATFDHLGGTNSSAAVFYVYKGKGGQDVFTLSFASGATLDIVDRHDLLFETTRKYVTLSYNNARSYLGKRFYNYVTGDWDELTAVTRAKDCDGHYSIYTRGHGNCVANGLLTVPDDKDCFVNVYELDETLKADAAQLAADSVTYGLATPADYPNVPEDDFEDGNVRYAFIAIGKGLTTQEEILFWNAYDYGPIVAKKALCVAQSLGMGPMKATAIAACAPSDPYLQIGTGAVVTGNVSTAGKDNVCLKPEEVYGTLRSPVIDILDGATGVDIGVTLATEGGVGIFGWTNAVNYAAFFFSDNPTYAVSYTADGELALRAGIQVGGDAWAMVDADGTCTISGTGAMWDDTEWVSGNPLAAVKRTIRSVVVADGVTSVGSRLFHKFHNLTNVVCAASVETVGSLAFYNCLSLQKLAFRGAKPTFGAEAFLFHTAIYLRDGVPTLEMNPQIEVPNYTRELQGKVDLADAWTPVPKGRTSDYRFFRFVLIED